MLAVAALCAGGGLWLLAHPSRPAAVTSRPTTLPSDAAGIEVDGGEVIVHVAGAVEAPGVYTLPGGSRVADAVDVAGGPSRKAVLHGLNLARPLTDGEQILVPDRTAAAASPPSNQPGGAPAAAPASAKVNLNQADAATLETLPNIGPVLAQRIIEHRDSVGGFTSVGQLREVTGIGEKTFQAIAEMVSV